MTFDGIVLGLFVVGAGIHIVWMMRGMVPAISSSDEASEMIVELMPEDFDGKVADLGAGWGALCFSIAARFPNAHVMAIEHSPLPWLFLYIQKRLFGFKNVEIIRRNLFDVDLRDVDIVTVYLLPEPMAVLAQKLSVELESGAMVLSNTFTLPGWRWQERHPYGIIRSIGRVVAIYQYEV